MRNSARILVASAAISFGESWNALPVHAQGGVASPLRSAIEVYGTTNAALLTRERKSAQMRRRSCRAKVCIGAAAGAGVGAVFGAVGVGSAGDRSAAAAYGAIIFSIVGAGFGYKACGP